jgi:type VI secretion system protein ImpC
MIDRDNFDDVMARLRVEVHLSTATESVPRIPIRFASLDDFHPDQIYNQVRLFETLRGMRDRLSDPRTFAEAARAVRGWAGLEPAPRSEPAERRAIPDTTAPASGSLLDHMLEAAEGNQQAAQRVWTSPELTALLRDVVRPHLVPEEDPQQAELIAFVDEAAGDLMRAILRHPEFQSIEAAWRAAYFLISRLETGTDLKLYLIDITKDELRAALTAEDVRATDIYKLIVEQTVETPGGQPWAALVGNYTFDATREDAELLARLGRLARRAGAPFIAAAHPRLAGCESLAATPDPRDWRQSARPDATATWAALRELPEAAYLGLALPRFLLRLPYGAETDPIDSFDFEEMPQIDHESYLWGNPAFACALLLGQAFSAEGWGLRPGIVQEIENLPLHVYETQDESEIKPCAEVTLTEQAVNSIIDKGLMPLLSYRGRDTIRLALFQSLAGGPIAGRWRN